MLFVGVFVLLFDGHCFERWIERDVINTHNRIIISVQELMLFDIEISKGHYIPYVKFLYCFCTVTKINWRQILQI